MNVASHYKTTVLGHGIYPDHEITPTLQDKIVKIQKFSGSLMI
jgi:hypothetical protein